MRCSISRSYIFFPIIDTRTVLILIDVSRAALFQVLAELHH
jgi:hypothetical protein